METFTQDLSSALPKVHKKEDWYAGELLSKSEYFKLNIYHILIKDCDKIGNLLPSCVAIYLRLAQSWLNRP